MRALREYALYAAVLVIAVLTYYPYRLFAQHTPILVLSGSGNFAYWHATLYWPSWSFFATFSGHAVGQYLHIRWHFRALALVLVFVAWCFVPLLDHVLGIDGYGSFGLNSYPSSLPGWNTPKLSVMLCPWAFFAGVVAGELAGWWYRRRTS
jgi:hypothetical protein